MASKTVAYYDNIYLVGTEDEKTSSHRVTEREGKRRPGVVTFTGNFLSSSTEETYGTLVINEDLWQKWFGDRNRLPSMDTAELAAQTLVSGHLNIYYGCPLCAWRGKVYDEYREHVHSHINKFIGQFRIEVEDNE